MPILLNVWRCLAISKYLDGFRGFFIKINAFPLISARKSGRISFKRQWISESWRSEDVCLEMSGDLEMSVWRCHEIWRYLVKYNLEIWRSREIWRYLVKYNQEIWDGGLENEGLEI